jgi:hypothetical protein
MEIPRGSAEDKALPSPCVLQQPEGKYLFIRLPRLPEFNDGYADT